jgi:hypothetical protein
LLRERVTDASAILVSMQIMYHQHGDENEQPCATFIASLFHKRKSRSVAN